MQCTCKLIRECWYKVQLYVYSRERERERAMQDAMADKEKGVAQIVTEQNRWENVFTIGMIYIQQRD